MLRCLVVFFVGAFLASGDQTPRARMMRKAAQGDLGLIHVPMADSPTFHSYSVAVVNTMPHAGQPWVEGLEYDPDLGVLIETSGTFPAGTSSLIRTMDPRTGKVLQTIKAGLGTYFLEGITAVGGGYLANTYMDHVVLQYDSNLNFVKTLPFNFEGWGFTHSIDGSTIYATNGSSALSYLDSATLQLLDVKVATCFGKQLPGINELESVANFQGLGPVILGNVINTRLVMVLDPATASCIGSFDLSGLETVDPTEAGGYHVANGIAYLSTGNLVVTGKNWNSMYEIKLSEEPPGPVPSALTSYLRFQPASLLAKSAGAILIDARQYFGSRAHQ